MIPFIIAGAVGFGIAKLFEKDDNKKYADGGEVVIYPTDSNGKTFKWINIDDKYQEVISDDISKKMGMVVRVLQGYDLFVLESETQNKKDYHILAQISTETGEIEMIKGKFNSEPSSKYQKYIDDLINKFNFSLNKDNYADGGMIGIGRYSILAQHSNGEEPLVMKRVNNRNEIAGMVDKVELAFKKLGYNDVTIFVTDEETDDEVYNYAEGGKAGKYNTYKLRAEGLNDFMNFLGTGVYSNVKSYTVEPIGFPDVAVSFETNLSLSEIKAKLREVQDSHVMLDTIKPIKEYTGERYEGGGDVESMSDEEIEDEYNKILSVQILAGDIDEDEVEELSISEKREFLENYKDEYAKGGLAKKRRRIASIQYGRSDRSVDKTRFAKPVGYRYTDEKATQLNKKTYTKPTEAQVKKYLGNGIYKENRKNRSDKDRKVKL